MSSRTIAVTQIDPVVGQRFIAVARFFSDHDGTDPIDPVSVTFRAQYPSDIPDDQAWVYETDNEVQRLSSGVYQWEHALQERGRVKFRVEGPGTHVGDAVEWSMRVRQSAFDALAGAGS